MELYWVNDVMQQHTYPKEICACRKNCLNNFMMSPNQKHTRTCIYIMDKCTSNGYNHRSYMIYYQVM